MAQNDKRANFKKMVAESGVKHADPSAYAESMPICTKCGRRILGSSGVCPFCADKELFAQVRDYIRENDVNEMQVAEHFGIPQDKVKDWIRDGRITYKEGSGVIILDNYCEVCGRPIAFGSVCIECKREFNNRQKHGVAVNPPVEGKVETSTMHFIKK